MKHINWTLHAVCAPRRLAGWLRTSLATFAGVAMLLVALPAAAQVSQIDHQQLTEMAAAGIPVVDIRTAREWKTTGVMEDSHQLTFFDERGQFDLNAWMEKFSAIAGPDDPVLIICAAGVRSAAVAKVLSDRLGYRQVHNVSRGIDDWMRRGGRTREWTP